MNTVNTFHKTLLSLSLSAILLSGCASAPNSPEGAADVRQQLSQLQADQQLAPMAPLAIKEAEQAVLLAEQPEKDKALAAHRLVMAERKVQMASTQAQTRHLEQQRTELSQRRDEVRLTARTQEANRARADASAARDEASGARSDTAFARQQAQAASSREQAARSDAQSARDDARLAQQKAEQSAAMATGLQQQIDELNAKSTERGLVVTLGDVLFNTGQSNLRGISDNHLQKLAQFLQQHPERTALIEGHTDSVGSASSNVLLSQRRADTVKAFLVAQGIAASRLQTAGKGLNSPVASNNTTDGRQQNRRVEVIITNSEQ